MLRSYKYRLYPTKSQAEKLIQFMGCVRFVYNKGLEKKIEYYTENKKSISYFELASSWLISLKEQNPFLKECVAQSLQMSLRNLDNAFTRFFHKKSQFPKFKNKHHKKSIQFPQLVNVDFRKSYTKIPKIGNIKTVFDREFSGKIKTVTISFTPTHKFFISILVDDGKELPVKPEIKEKNAIGIDLGIKDFAILSNGEKISNPKFLNKSLSKLRKAQQSLSRKRKGSNKYNKQKLKVAKIHEKITNQRKDFLHKVTSKIICDNQTIIIEDLVIQNMIKNRKLSRSISDVGWGYFKQFLEYKSEWYGRNIIKIGRFQPSSKTCSKCGHLNHELKLSDRSWKCNNCYTFHDRDINAAINIKNFGLLSQSYGSGIDLNALGEDKVKKKKISSKKREVSEKR